MASTFATGVPAATSPSSDGVPPAVRGSRRRRAPGSRWSRGHVLMVLAATVAVLGNLVLLRGDAAQRSVVVAARDLAPGAVVASDDLTTATVPDAGALASLPTEPQALVGLVVTGRVGEGDLLRRSDVAAPTAADARMRHLSLAVPPERAVGGRLRADDRVDVIAVDEGGARYLVTGVRVVAVGAPSAGLGQLTGHHVVVEVDADAALCLAAAVAAGGIDLVRTTGQDGAVAEGCR